MVQPGKITIIVRFNMWTKPAKITTDYEGINRYRDDVPIYDVPNLTYDDINTFYDGYNTSGESLKEYPNPDYIDEFNSLNNWSPSLGVHTAYILNNQLVLPTNEGVGDTGLYYNNEINLENKYVSIQIISVGDFSVGEFSISPIYLVDYTVQLHMSFYVSVYGFFAGTSVGIGPTSDRNTIDCGDFDINVHKYLRIGEIDGYIDFGYSTNGSDWFSFGSIGRSSLPRIDEMEMYIYADDFSGTGTEQLVVDNFKISPYESNFDTPTSSDGNKHNTDYEKSAKNITDFSPVIEKNTTDYANIEKNTTNWE